MPLNANEGLATMHTFLPVRLLLIQLNIHMRLTARFELPALAVRPPEAKSSQIQNVTSLSGACSDKCECERTLARHFPTSRTRGPELTRQRHWAFASSSYIRINHHFRGFWPDFDLFLSDAKMRTGAQHSETGVRQGRNYDAALQPPSLELSRSGGRKESELVHAFCAPGWFGAVISQ